MLIFIDFMKNIHAIGDRANSVVLDAIESGIYNATIGSKLSDTRARIEHAQIIRPEDAVRLANLGGAFLEVLGSTQDYNR